MELHLTAGHFDGHTVLFDRSRGILFCGDALKFEMAADDPRQALTISAHKAFVRGIPLTPRELRRLSRRVSNPCRSSRPGRRSSRRATAAGPKPWP